MREKDYFLLYPSFNFAAKLLSYEERGRLWEAVFAFVETGEVIALPLTVQLAFAPIHEHLIAHFARKGEISEKRVHAVQTRWQNTNVSACIQRHTSDANVSGGIQRDTNVYITEQNITKQNTISRKNALECVFSFPEFWELYAKKNDKIKCEKAFAKLSEAERVKIKTLLPQYIEATPDVRYRKNPLTWLNGRCWLDEISTPSQTLKAVL